jgi:hypothetical protein
MSYGKKEASMQVLPHVYSMNIYFFGTTYSMTNEKQTCPCLCYSFKWKHKHA